MNELWRARCVGVEKNCGFDLGEVVIMEKNGKISSLKDNWNSNFSNTSFKYWQNYWNQSKWELIHPTQDTLTPEEVIELLIEITGSEEVANCKKFFGDGKYDIYDILDGFTPSEIIQKLTDYKKSKQAKVISKQEYDKAASDKLDEIYPGGWRLE